MLFKRLILIISIFLIFNGNSLYAKIKTSIIFKINNEIVTNIDLENEKRFLIFLNPKLSNLSENQIENISLNSLKNRKIKKIELDKFLDLTEIKNDEIYIKNFISSTKLRNIDDLKVELIKFKIDYNFFLENFKIDNIWREFIFNKFNSQVKINVDELKKQVQIKQNEINELNLSEILFQANDENELEEMRKKIYQEINKSNFEAAAGIYSISQSKEYGGKLGWIRSNQISEKIYSLIKNIKDVSEPIKTENGYLILKVNEKRKFNDELNLEQELEKMINQETQAQLNKFGYIYFNKIKKRIFISEN